MSGFQHYLNLKTPELHYQLSLAKDFYRKVVCKVFARGISRKSLGQDYANKLMKRIVSSDYNSIMRFVGSLQAGSGKLTKAMKFIFNQYMHFFPVLSESWIDTEFTCIITSENTDMSNPCYILIFDPVDGVETVVKLYQFKYGKNPAYFEIEQHDDDIGTVYVYPFNVNGPLYQFKPAENGAIVEIVDHSEENDKQEDCERPVKRVKLN